MGAKGLALTTKTDKNTPHNQHLVVFLHPTPVQPHPPPQTTDSEVGECGLKLNNVSM